MKNYLKVLFLFSLIALGSSCRSYFHGFTEGREYDLSEIKSPYAFYSGQETCVYNTDMQLFKRQINGLLIIKRTNDSTFRLVFTPKVGPKLFDISINQQQYLVHYCMEAFNRKSLIRLLVHDLRLCLLNYPQQSLYTYGSDSLVRYKLADTKHVVINKPPLTPPSKVVELKWRRPSTQIDYKSWQQGIPNTIFISHRRLHFSLHLKRL